MPEYARRLMTALVAACLAAGAAAPAAAQSAGAPLGDPVEQRFVVHEGQGPTLEAAFVARDGSPVRVADFAGRHVLVNFWAPSCEGSRWEVPTLERLQETIGSERLAVVLVASDKGGWVPIDLFRNALGIDDAQIFLDNDFEVLAESGLTRTRMGSVLYGPDGSEVGRIDAWADWDTPAATALIERFVSR